MKTIITMTSWVGRINYVARSIYNFITNQTVKPDIFYLWLSIKEFPNKENDLPEELIIVCKKFNVIIEWLNNNEYVHKRWNVYPKHYNDLVISIDEDLIFDNDLIKDAINATKKYEGQNISFNIFKTITLKIEPLNSIKYRRNYNISDKPSLLYNMNGCHVFPPQTFPLDAVSSENKIIRDNICKDCDESWILPFLKYNNGLITYLNDKSDISKQLPIARSATALNTKNNKTYNDIKRRDISLYFVLRTFPKLMQKWKMIYPNYNTNEWDKYTDEQIKNIFKILDTV